MLIHAMFESIKALFLDKHLIFHMPRFHLTDCSNMSHESIVFVICRSKQQKVDMHPEKRMKAAYAAYESRQLPLLKEQNPNLRLSQIKQMIKKDWQKSPENPMIQAMQAAQQ